LLGKLLTYSAFIKFAKCKGNWMMGIYSLYFDDIWVSIACDREQIFASSFGSTQQSAIGKILEMIPFGVPFQVLHEPTLFARSALASLKSLYDGKKINLDFSLALGKLPVYTQKVLKATLQVPLGYVTTYGAIAKAVGGGPRAVGNIMASNPFAPIVPCHRVVRANFKIGGYGLGGFKVKVELLSREKQGFLGPKEIMVNGRGLEVFPVEVVLKGLDLLF
jgi:O-6-methylguanine DNA methyltransferase